MPWGRWERLQEIEMVKVRALGFLWCNSAWLRFCPLTGDVCIPPWSVRMPGSCVVAYVDANLGGCQVCTLCQSGMWISGSDYLTYVPSISSF
jgi:hypothetical protein